MQAEFCAARNSILLPSIRHSAQYPVGMSIRDILVHDNVPAQVWDKFKIHLNGVEAPRPHWARIRPKPNTMVTIEITPGVGENSLIDTGTLRVIGFIATVFAANAIPGMLGLGGLYGGVLRTVLTFLGIFIVSSLIDIPEEGEPNEYYGIKSIRNGVRQYQPVPKLYGKLRVFPDLASVPVTELVGDDQFIKLLFCVGVAPLKISELKFGDKLVSKFEGVEIKQSTGWGASESPVSFFSDNEDPQEDIIDQELKYANAWVALLGEEDFMDGQQIPYSWLDTLELHENVVTMTTQQDAIRISLDLVFPDGLYYKDGNGAIHSDRCDVSIRFRPVGSTGGNEDWIYVFPAWGVAGQVEEINRLTETQLFQNLVELNAVLVDVVEQLNLISALERKISAKLLEWAQTQILNSQRQATFLIQAGTLTGGQVTQLTELGQTLQDLGTTLGTAATLTQDFASQLGDFNKILSVAIKFIEAVDDLLALRDYVHNGYGPDLATLPAFSRWLVKKRNLTRLFGNPETGSFIIVNEDTRTGLFRRGITWHTAPGEYEVQIRRTNPESEDREFSSTVEVSVFRSFRRVAPVASAIQPQVALVAVRVKASEDLNGSLDQFNLIAEAPLRWHDGNTWQPYALVDGDGNSVSKNMAWQFCDALFTCGATVDEIDLPTILEFSEFCISKGLQFNNLFTTKKTLTNTLNDILRLGRGSLRLEGRGKYSIAYDHPRTTYSDVITVRNTDPSFSSSKAMVDRPEALLITFNNPDKGYATDQMYVYADGFGPAGVETGGLYRLSGGGDTLLIPFEVWKIESVWDTVTDTEVLGSEFTPRYTASGTELYRVDEEDWATGDYRFRVKFTYFGQEPSVVEKIKMVGLVDTHRQSSEHHTGMCYSLGRYLLAVARLRPEVMEQVIFFEHMKYDKGDRILMQSDVTKWGILAARVVAVDDAGGFLFGLGMDESLTVAADKSYSFLVRAATGEVVTGDIDNAVGTSSDLVFNTPGIDMDGVVVAVGDLVVVGERNKIGVPVIITALAPESPDRATLTLVEDHPAIHEASDILIPEYDPHITTPDIPTALRPPAPVVASIKTDESVLTVDSAGNLVSRILLNITLPRSIGGNPLVSALQVQYRYSREVTNTDPNVVVVYKPRSIPVVQYGWQEMPLTYTKMEELSVFPVDDGAYYDLRVRSLGGLGVPSDWVFIPNIYVVGKTSSPPDVRYLRLDGRTLRWDYPTPPLDLAGFIIKTFIGSGGSWGWGKLAGSVPANARSFTSPEYLSGGKRRVMVKAVDTSGIESSNEAFLDIELSEPDTGTVLGTIDHRALGWPGVAVNLTEDTAGDLCEDAGSKVEFYRARATPFYRASEKSFYETEYPGYSYSATYSVSASDLPCEVSVSIEVEGEDWKLLVSQDIVDLLDTNGNTQLLQENKNAMLFHEEQTIEGVYKGKFRPEEGVVYTFRVFGEPNDAQGKLKEFTIIVDRV